MFIVNIIFKIYYKILDFVNIPGRYSFEFFFSQNKDPANNIKLSKNRVDKFGLKKLDINWKISENDITIYEKMIKKFLSSSNLLINKSFSLNKIEKNVYVGLHPSCSNSLGVNKDNIVDTNLRIKKFSNLFICGSDVFPSNGFTNPTWTIMTLGTRLSFYLKKKFK